MSAHAEPATPNREPNVNTNPEHRTQKREPSRVFEVARLFLRLGLTAFGGPAAHVALIQRECVDERQWMTRQQFLDLLAVASLIPGPTSTELAMHVGRLRAGWAGLLAAGAAFILPSTIIVGLLAALYVRSGDLPVTRGVLLTVQPVVVVMVIQAVVPLGRDALRSPLLVAIAGAAIVAALAGVPEIYVLLAAGAIGAIRRSTPLAALAVAAGGAVLLAAEPVARAAPADVVAYFLRVGSLLFGSGYVLLPVLQGDLVDRLGWLSDRELLDAIAAGQATPGPLFTTAAFIGYLLGGPSMALAATVAMFAPAFFFSAVSSVLLDRLRTSASARAFLDGVNAAAVALIALVVVTLGRVAFTGPLPIAVGMAAAVAILLVGIRPTWVLLIAAACGAGYGLFEG